ncbi:MAG: DUF3592 domain-containing protein [Burkholderiales bacterium]|nr:MAG: DUF3592 domain-containing protein [Burkholderiales bacterium]
MISESGKRFLAAISICFSLALLTIDYNWAKDLAIARQATHWPKVRGLIWKSEIAQGCKHDFQADVRYSYTALGRTYSGQRIAFGPAGCLSEQDARNAVSRFPLGEVNVSFDPLSPSYSALMVGQFLPEAKGGIVLLNVMLLGSASLGIGLLWSGRGRRTNGSLTSW